MSVLKFALLDFPVALTALQNEVRALLANRWQPHFNTQQYVGEWTVLPLRSAGGGKAIFADSLDGTPFADTPVLEQCPSIQHFLRTLQCETGAVRLLNLKAGAIIKEHTDKDLCFESGEVRLHIPVFTHPLVDFFLDGEKLPMQEGECWYINANLPHRLANNGPYDRIHLVIDGKVNGWVKDLFQQKSRRKREISREELSVRNRTVIEGTIAELRRQPGNKAAATLATKLEFSLQRAIAQVAGKRADEPTKPSHPAKPSGLSSPSCPTG